jgi:hypothetical protein
VAASDKQKEKMANQLADNAMRNDLALAAANNAAAAQRQTSVNDTQLKTTGMNNDTTLAINKPLMEGQSLRNDVYAKTGMAEAANTLANNQNNTKLNIKFGDPSKQAALDTQLALKNDLITDINKRKSDANVAKFNMGGAATVQNDAADRNANDVTKAELARRTKISNFEPFAAGTSGDDNSDFIDKGRAELGDAPRSTTARVLNSVIPFSRPIQAARIKERLLANPIYQ